MKYSEELKKIVLSQEWLMDVLRAVRSLGLPDWYVAAGAIRNTVWNHLHGISTELNQNDIDVVYFDASDMKGLNEKKYTEELKKKISLEWEVVNQARMHLFERKITRPPVKSSCASIAFWTETATCVGVRLEEDDSLTICAPHGLEDLFELVIRMVRDPELFLERLKEKQWTKKWEKLSIQ